MNWSWNTNHDNYYYNSKRTGKTYWQNLTAPLSEGEKILRYWCCCIFGCIMVCVLLYKFRTDVDYELQFQLTFISTKYHWLSSDMLCTWLIILVLFGLIIKRWWYWFINNIWLTLLLIAKNKMEDIDVYKQAMFNGIIMTKEFFNYTCNFYLYKALTVEQVKFAVFHEFRTRYSSISFLTYRDCRYGFVDDPWVEFFFQDFFLDLNDVKSFERIRNQIDIYQKNKLHDGQQIMDIRDLEYIRDHPVKYYFEKYSDIVGDFLYEHTGHVIFWGFVGVVVASVLWYNLVEDPNIKQNILTVWNRWVDNGFNPAINPKGKPIDPESLTPVIDTLSSKLIQIFGQDNPQEYLGNLQILITQNAELLRLFSESSFVSASVIKNLGPELAQKAYDTLLPQTITQMVPQMLSTQDLCIEIVEKIAENMNYSPFEQFEVIILQRISFFGIDLSFTNLTLFLFISLSVIVFFSHVISKSLNLIPNYWQSVIEIFYGFIFSMLVDQAGKKAKVFFPAIFSVFFFILVNNLLGLIPLSFAVTSHVVITFCLGFGFFVAWVIVAFKTIGLKVFNIFWPTNVPLWLRPLLMVVEILSFSLRPFSLSIRLFVNMLAGHVLLHLVGGSVVLVFSKAAIFSFIPFILLLAVFCLELGIAFLQAYIFSILLCIYLHDSYHVHGH
jgi:F-type H+-transporting ATPase subunit a